MNVLSCGAAIILAAACASFAHSDKAAADAPRIVNRATAEAIWRAGILKDLRLLSLERHYCVQRVSATGPLAEFRCKTTSVARDHIGRAFGSAFADGVIADVMSVGEMLGFGRSAFARCAEGRGYVDANVQFRDGQPGVKAADMANLADGSFKITGDSAQRMAGQCTGGTAGGGVGGDGGSFDDGAQGGRPSFDDFMKAGLSLFTPERDHLIGRARAMLKKLSVCTVSSRAGLVGSAGGETEGLPGQVSSQIYNMSQTQSSDAILDLYGAGADYEANGSPVPGDDVVRHRSVSDPENSWMDVYGPNNGKGVPEGTVKERLSDGSVRTTEKSVEGTRVTTVSMTEGANPKEIIDSTLTRPDGRTTQMVIANNAMTVTNTYPPGTGPRDGARQVTQTVNTFSGVGDRGKLTSQTTVWSDGSQTVVEFNADGTIKRATHTPAPTPTKETKRPTPDDPNAGTCKGRARWVAMMLKFCDSQQWQSPNCMVILLAANNCADPNVARPTPDGPDMVCHPRGEAFDSRREVCKRRGWIEAQGRDRDSRGGSCETPQLSGRFQRDPAWIDPVPVDARPDQQMGIEAPGRPGR